MSRGSSDRAGAGEPSASSTSGPPAVALTDELRTILLPWVDLAEVGTDGLAAWLRSVLPLIPIPGAVSLEGRDLSRGSLEKRLTRLAQALADSAADRARAHFQASEYFRENRVLVRRIKALEAIARTQAKSEGRPDPVPPDPAADAAAERYLPPAEPSSRPRGQTDR